MEFSTNCLAAQRRLLGAGSVERITPLFRVSSFSQREDFPRVQTHRDGPHLLRGQRLVSVSLLCASICIFYTEKECPRASQEQDAARPSSGKSSGPWLRLEVRVLNGRHSARSVCRAWFHKRGR